MSVDYTKLLNKIAPKSDGQLPPTVRVGTVAAVNADGTLDVAFGSGVVIPSVFRLSSVRVVVGDVVQMLAAPGSILVIGPVGGTMLASGQRIATNVRTSNSSTTTTTETVIDSVSAPLVSGLTYKVRWTAAVDSSVAGDTVFVRIREDNLAGTQLMIMRASCVTTGGAGTRWPCHIETEYTAVSTGDKTFVGTLLRVTGGGDVNIESSAQAPVILYVDYVRG